MTRSNTTRTALNRRNLFLIGGVAMLAVIVTILSALTVGRVSATAADDPTPTPVATPVVTPEPSEEPSESPVPSQPDEPVDTPAPVPSEPTGPRPVVQAPDGVFPPGGVVRVTADALRVRDDPLLRSDELMVLHRGDLLVVGPTYGFGAFGPATADGYVWVPVGVLGLDELPEPGGAPMEFVERGYVAVGDGDSEWLELLDARCTDDEPTLQHLSSLTEWERLACYGDRQITFEGVLGCPGCGGLLPARFTPEWLASPSYNDPISVEPQEVIGPMDLHWAPDGPERPNTGGVAPILRVTGHFDDPAADSCSIVFMSGPASGLEESEVDPSVSKLYCRTNFVVDSYEVIGEDEDFPFS
jgi:hypothetical protein